MQRAPSLAEGGRRGQGEERGWQGLRTVESSHRALDKPSPSASPPPRAVASKRAPCAAAGRVFPVLRRQGADPTLGRPRRCEGVSTRPPSSASALGMFVWFLQSEPCSDEKKGDPARKTRKFPIPTSGRKSPVIPVACGGRPSRRTASPSKARGRRRSPLLPHHGASRSVEGLRNVGRQVVRVDAPEPFFERPRGRPQRVRHSTSGDAGALEPCGASPMGQSTVRSPPLEPAPSKAYAAPASSCDGPRCSATIRA